MTYLDNLTPFKFIGSGINTQYKPLKLTKQMRLTTTKNYDYFDRELTLITFDYEERSVEEIELVSEQKQRAIDYFVEVCCDIDDAVEPNVETINGFFINGEQMEFSDLMFYSTHLLNVSDIQLDLNTIVTPAGSVKGKDNGTKITILLLVFELPDGNTMDFTYISETL